MANSEIGRELSAAELVPKTVVIIGREDRPYKYTVWVAGVGGDSVSFYSGVGNSTFIAYLREDGKLQDDTGQEIHVYEYLGTI
jgi:hypothetical protein